MKRTSEAAAETRAALLVAALRVFARQGFARTTLTDVGNEAGLTRGAIYHHFTDKTDLFVSCVSERWEQIMAEVWDLAPSSAPPRESIHRFLVSFCQSLQQEESRQLLLITMASREPLPPAAAGMDAKRSAIRGIFDYFLDLCVQARDAGQLYPDLSAEAATQIIICGLSGLVSLSSLDLDGVLKCTVDPEDMSAAIIRGIFI